LIEGWQFAIAYLRTSSFPHFQCGFGVGVELAWAAVGWRSGGNAGAVPGDGAGLVPPMECSIIKGLLALVC